MDLLKVGQKVTLYIQKQDTMVEMACTIEKLFDDRLDLVLPQYFMRYIEYLQVGNRVTAKVFSKFGTIDFNTIILSSPLEETFTIELDYNSMRLKEGSELPVINSLDIMEINSGNTVNRYKTFELSTDHVKFYSDRTFEIGETFEASIKFPQNYGIINFKAHVTEQDEIYKNEYTARFLTLSEDARQNLLYYIYIYGNNIDIN